MTRYRNHKLLVLSIPVLYALIAMSGIGRHAGELFPFFNWSLFSSVRSPISAVELQVAAVGDTRFEPPVDFYELPEVFPAAAAKTSATMKLAERLGLTILNRQPGADAIRPTLENRYLSIGDRVEYRLVWVTYDPLDRIRNGEVQNIRVIETGVVEGKE